MHRIMVAAAMGLALTGPAMAQGLGDVGRLLQEQVLPRQGADPRQQDRDRAIYEQGRRDEEARREELRRREAGRDGDRRFEERRDANRGEARRGEARRDDDRRGDFQRNDDRRRDEDRFRTEQDRQPRRY